MDPTRWTVLDVRTLASIRAVEYSSVPAIANALGITIDDIWLYQEDERTRRSRRSRW